MDNINERETERESNPSGKAFFFFFGVKCFYAHTSEKGDKPSSSPLIPNVELCNPQETLYQTLRQVTQKANMKEFFREKQVLGVRGFLDLSITSTVLDSVCRVSCPHGLVLRTSGACTFLNDTTTTN